MTEKIWLQPRIIAYTQILLDNFNHLLGYQLISRKEDTKEQAKALFKADFVVVSHGIQTDPILNYGNQTALDLWVMDWADFTQTPSRLTAEPMNRSERAAMLEPAKIRGYIDNYQGVRIASTGQKFYIKQAIIWNLVDSLGNKCGQAATFSDWETIE
ncbi:MEKHLA domain-containing protein [Hyella patelloides LEGE 07179]|uniref:MEKHLA domain-containing protein n=1 Tax=Hyella patelloides LEGE 07179 TaxID=945734 RepID=A0A563VIS3_9CYAN|nr:MEKHLA domain-containing protein [Hyella patelloides]VEP11334.1 MEKHLA domain-containing protein [Hyella patelloides LEGE 07179]